MNIIENNVNFKETVRTYENSDIAMVDINKKLALSLERADSRAVQSEKKMEKLKRFKKQIKYAENLTCRVINCYKDA